MTSAISSRSSSADPPSTSPAAVVQIFGARPFQTDGTLLAMAFAADGGLWSVDEPGVLRNWDDSGRQLSWRPLGVPALLWEFSRGARLLAAASDDVTVWDVVSGKPQAVLPRQSWITALAFSPDASFLAVGQDDGGVGIWHVAERRQVREWQAHHSPVSALAFSAEGTALASAGEDRTICLWNTDDAQLTGTLHGHTDRIPALAWQPGGQRLYSAGWDTTVRVWDTTACEPVILLNSHATQVTALALNGAGTLLASADSANALHLWALPSYRTREVLHGHQAEIRTLTFSPDGRQLASGGMDQVIRFWPMTAGAKGQVEAAAPTAPEVPPPCSQFRPSLATSPDGRLLRTGGGTALSVWDTKSAQPLIQLEQAGALDAVACSPDGRWIAGSAADVALRLWDAPTGKLRHILEGQQPPITALAFAADSALLAAGSSRSTDIWLWDVAKGAPLLLVPEAADGCSVEAMAFHPQSRLLAVGGVDWLATGGSDGAVCAWDLDNRCVLVTLEGGVTAVAFHPSGNRLAVASLLQTIRIWDTSEWRSGGLRRRPRAELTGHVDAVTCVAYSPDGRWLASGSIDHSVRLWDADTCTRLGEVTLDTQVRALSFSPDGRYLFTGNGNSSCYQLEVRSLLTK